jgi:hypothetical protein
MVFSQLRILQALFERLRMLNDYLIFVCVKYCKVKSLLVYFLCWYICCNFVIIALFLDFLGHRVSKRLSFVYVTTIS